MAIPRPDDGTPDGAALAALVDFCMTASGPLTTAGAMQHFPAPCTSACWRVHWRAPATTGSPPKSPCCHLRAGTQRYWLQLQRHGEGVAAGAESDAMAMATGALPAEETERLRQLEMARRGLPAAGSGGAPGDGSEPRAPVPGLLLAMLSFEVFPNAPMFGDPAPTNR